MTVTTVTFVTHPRRRCGRPTPSGRPCCRTPIPFGPHRVCPVHIGPRQPAPAVICPHPGKPHTAFGEAPRAWRDSVEKGEVA